MTIEQSCPCGSNHAFESCCGRYISGKVSAPTAESLMRSRYSAYATGVFGYLRDTCGKALKDSFDEQALKNWSKHVCWKRLQILSTRGGGEGDQMGEVTFIAYFSQGGIEKSLSERSQFAKIDGKWFYVGGL